MFFSDVVGFTTLSAELSPEAVSRETQTRWKETASRV